MAFVLLVGSGCGSSGSSDSPPAPDTIIDAIRQFVDVGEQYELDASRSSDPDGNELSFFWRILSGGEDTFIEDHCEDDFEEVCVSNDDDHCSDDVNQLCTTNDDCSEFATCDLGSGTSSADCTTGLCAVDEGPLGTRMTFVADVPGPFQVRLTAVSDVSSGASQILLDTFPSLYVVGSLLTFGGTAGGFVGEIADAKRFTPNATYGVANPQTGSLLVVDPVLRVLREFDLHDGTILGAFGETDEFIVSPVALAFDGDEVLAVAEASGPVRLFDAATGLLIGDFGDVGAGTVALEFSPLTSELFVVDGGPGVRVFDDGALVGTLAGSDASVGQGSDLAFLDGGCRLLVSDLDGDVRDFDLCDGPFACDVTDGGCVTSDSFGDVGDQLDPGAPSSVAVNPSADDTEADVVLADPVGRRVVACDESGFDCSTFGAASAAAAGRGSDPRSDSDFTFVFFAPKDAPTTSTTTSSSTTTTTLAPR